MQFNRVLSIREMTRAMPEDIRQARIMEIPLQRPGRPEDIANMVVFLCSEYSSYITGTVIEVAEVSHSVYGRTLGK